MDGEWLTYASIPVIAGIIGDATNGLAAKMTFVPLAFVGISRHLGWQDIIPSRARRMASIAVDTTLAEPTHRPVPVLPPAPEATDGQRP